ncbi:MAG: TatD family hydrolase [Gemmatimonadota bacterium]|nr:MAG: TatD family hydrolase [Gemmatimonadota bacterium]
MRLFDSHAHLTDESFAPELGDVLARAAERGVDAVVSIASELDDARAAIELARTTSRPRVWATAGIHPHHAERCTPETLAELEQLARSDLVVAVGETGLDFHYENAPRRRQIEAFRAQLGVAERLDLPVVVHSRAADDETAALIREYADRVVGVLHCFSGGAELLKAGLEGGWYVSFSGLVTFKNFRDLESVQQVPGDRLLVETDSPYLAPVPLRGRRNEPAFVEHTLRRLAEIRGEDPGGIAEATFENARRFYGL